MNVLPLPECAQLVDDASMSAGQCSLRRSESSLSRSSVNVLFLLQGLEQNVHVMRLVPK